jgi:hypothetical protein
MKKLIVISVFAVMSLAACYRIYARGGGDSFAGGMAGGMFGGLLGGTIASSANRSSDDGGSHRAVRNLREEMDDLRRAVKADLEGLNNKIDKIWREVKQLKKQVGKAKKSKRFAAEE